MPRPTRRTPHGAIWSTLAVTILLLTAISGAQAQQGASDVSGGTLVRPTDGDVAMPYRETPDLSICYIDMDGTGHYSQGDSVVLTFRSTCSGTSDRNDIRLVDWEGNPAGERLGSGTERGIPLQSVSPEPRFYYFDQANTNRLTPDDTVYLRLHSSELELVRTEDIRITAYEDHAPGSEVQSGDDDQGRGLRLLGTASQTLRHVDVLGTEDFTHHDAVYLSAITDRSVAAQGDVRIYGPEEGLDFGQFLGPGDPEPQDTVRTLNRYVCTTDESDTGIYNPGDPLYFSIGTQCQGDVQAGDIRLSASDHGEAGSRVQDGDADHGNRYGILTETRLAYIDLTGTGTFERGDVAVLRNTNPQENELKAGDMLLTPTNRGAGALVLEGDPLIGTATYDLGVFDTMVVFKPTGGATSLRAHDPIYLSPGTVSGDGLNPQDIRLTPAGVHPFGGPVGLDTGEMRSGLARGTASVCTTEPIGEEYSAGDPVYLRLGGGCPSIVTTGLVRLVPVGGYPAFSTVHGDDTDRGQPLFTPQDTPVLRYLSIGEAGWGYSTRLYLNIVSPNENGVQIGDIRLTPAGDGLDAGRAVLASDSDRNIPEFNLLGNLADHTGFIDVTDSGAFTTRDHAYILFDPDQVHVTPLSVRLTPLPAAFNPLEVQEPAQPENGDPTNGDPSNGDPSNGEPSNGDPSTDDTTDDQVHDDEDEERKTPGPGVALVLSGILATLLWRGSRSRRE